ncbi:MAG: hypothetical protein OJF47_000441 [Nitrospira sp.]|jgi:hypothetical protein|nr:MAG: hypothetical protein OJF47_000441 [Nitrospira sp.]
MLAVHVVSSEVTLLSATKGVWQIGGYAASTLFPRVLLWDVRAAVSLLMTRAIA